MVNPNPDASHKQHQRDAFLRSRKQHDFDPNPSKQALTCLIVKAYVIPKKMVCQGRLGESLNFAPADGVIPHVPENSGYISAWHVTSSSMTCSALAHIGVGP